MLCCQIQTYASLTDYLCSIILLFSVNSCWCLAAFERKKKWPQKSNISFSCLSSCLSHSQPSMSFQKTSLPRSRGRKGPCSCIHSVWVFHSRPPEICIFFSLCLRLDWLITLRSDIIVSSIHYKLRAMKLMSFIKKDSVCVCVPPLSPGHLHVLRSGHRLWWLLRPFPWENIWGEEGASTSLHI